MIANRLLLKQARKAINTMIEQSPFIVSITHKATKDDGFGGTVIDPFGSETTNTYMVRISHERKGPDSLNPTDAGLSTGLVRYITFKHTDDIREGDVFDALGIRYRVGPVDPLEKFGGTAGYQAPLYEAADAVPSPEET